MRPLLRTATAQACKIGKNPYFEGPDRLNRRGGAVMLISAVWTILSSDDLSKNIRVKIQEVTSDLHMRLRPNDIKGQERRPNALD